ncbi:hypothetical protein FRB91_009841 [Serendipita sp. 411]|nr:hypothetical protein FRB91_009841 [Serendipita sp. 411]
MFASALAALLLASLVRSEPVPLEPSGTSVFNEGGNCTILWTPDTTGVWTTMNIELMTGDNFNQVHLKTVATVDGTDATNPSFSYPCLSVTQRRTSFSLHVSRSRTRRAIPSPPPKAKPPPTVMS